MHRKVRELPTWRARSFDCNDSALKIVFVREPIFCSPTDQPLAPVDGRVGDAVGDGYAPTIVRNR